jgi:hypothetical protein
MAEVAAIAEVVRQWSEVEVAGAGIDSHDG